MKEKVEEAVEYASSSNKLEDNNLSVAELDKIVQDIMNGKSDKSFLYSVAEFVKKHEKYKSEEKDDILNGKTRK